MKHRHVEGATPQSITFPTDASLRYMIHEIEAGQTTSQGGPVRVTITNILSADPGVPTFTETIGPETAAAAASPDYGVHRENKNYMVKGATPPVATVTGPVTSTVYLTVGYTEKRG